MGQLIIHNRKINNSDYPFGVSSVEGDNSTLSAYLVGLLWGTDEILCMKEGCISYSNLQICKVLTFRILSFLFM